MEVTFCDELPGGIGWIAAEPAFMRRASHALASGGRVWLVDPVDGEGVLDRVRALGTPAGVVQLLDRHGRDCASLAERLGVPLHRVPRDGVPGSPFRTLPVRRIPTWHEVALWWPEARVLVAADALGTAPYFLAPGARLGVHPLMRLAPPAALRGLDPEHVLVGHGEGVHGPEAAPALERALAGARREAPAWAWHLVRTRAWR